MSRVYCIIILILSVGLALSGTITGKVATTDGRGLPGANVFLQGTLVGAATMGDGTYSIEVPDGSYSIVCDYVGYAQQVIEITISGNVTQDFEMVEYLFAKTISVVADRARERETPVAFSNLEKERIEATLGSRDIPLVLNTTPSVYATQSGGGAGDARINVRGFNQRNVAIMLNGMPVNDMENGWVYWSNWDGVGDAASSIQIQRGLSAVNLATPSIGGTMNIITDPTSMNPGIKFRQEFGNDGFLKTSVSGATGLINDTYAVNATVVRKVGDGLIDKTWTDAWAYYLGASYNIDKNNRLELYALGAPQRHGQNLYKQNIGAYNASYAKDLDDYDEAALDDYAESDRGYKYNQTWGPVSSSYKGKQHWDDSSDDRYDSGFINERENFYHKPLVNLNLYSQLSKDLSLYNIVYYSGGKGGGTGTYGRTEWNFSGPSRTPDWNASIARNVDSTTFRYGAKELGQSVGILRNSVNRQWTVGLISKAYYKVNENLNTVFGVDWRTAEIEHFREVRDLLGGTYFNPEDNQLPVSDFWTGSDFERGLGEKIDYDFTNTVDWIGFFGQGEYTAGQLSVYGMAGYSQIKYSYENFFRTADTLANGDPDRSSGTLQTESDWITGLQIKGGANFRISDQFSVFGNYGYVSKVPIFDEVIDDRNALKNDDHENEIFQSVEAGVGFISTDRALSLKGNFYFTRWENRTYKAEEFGPDEILIFLSGVDANHAGVEFEGAFQPNQYVRFDAAASIGVWEYTSDVSGQSRVPGTLEQQDYRFYIKDLKVGDSPQTQLALAASVFPVPGAIAQLSMRHYRDHFAEFNPFSRTDPTDRVQSWQAPNYTVFDLHASYNLPLEWNGIGVQVFAHVFNLFDETYIQDAVDNSEFNSFDDDHDADDAEVYFGLPQFINFGITITY